MLGEKVTMEIENTNVYHVQLTTYRDKHKYKHRFTTAQSTIKVEQDNEIKKQITKLLDKDKLGQITIYSCGIIGKQCGMIGKQHFRFHFPHKSI